MKITKKTDKKDMIIVVKIVLSIMLLLFITEICPFYFQNDTFYDLKLGQKYFNSRNV